MTSDLRQLMLIDTHSHLHFKAYDADREAVHARMAEFGVKTITIGTAINTSREAVAYADVHPDVWAAVGFHPDHVTSEHMDESEGDVLAEPYNVEALERLVKSSPRVLALGETGLDFHYFSVDASESEIARLQSEQRQVFLEHAKLGAEYDKALIVHSRDAGVQMLEALQEVRTRYPNLRMVVHAFNGTGREASDILDLGCWLGIGGIVTFKPRKGLAPEDTLSAIAAKMPLHKLLLETDAPWLAPVPVRGERNEPTFVRHIAQHITEARGMALADVCNATTENAEACFKTNFA